MAIVEGERWGEGMITVDGDYCVLTVATRNEAQSIMTSPCGRLGCEEDWVDNKKGGVDKCGLRGLRDVVLRRRGNGEGAKTVWTAIPQSRCQKLEVEESENDKKTHTERQKGKAKELMTDIIYEG